jgi:hypothetical protein
MVLERAVRVEKNTAMIGWVCLYRILPERLNRYLKEGLKIDINLKTPELEISYAKHISAPKGLLIHGVRAEIKHIDELSENGRPTILACIEKDNIASIKLAERVGFECLGDTLYETKSEYEEDDKYVETYDYIYQLNWDKFYLF